MNHSINKVSVRGKKWKIVKIKLCNEVIFTDVNHMHEAISLRTLLFKIESWNTNCLSNLTFSRGPINQMATSSD